MKYVIYKDPWHGPNKYEVRTDGDVTVAYCSSREEAKRIAHALNTKPARVKVESILDMFDPPGGKRVPIDKTYEQVAESKYGTNVEKFLIHPDLAGSAKVEWPDVDLDK
jgi:hypothetical protein